MSSGFTRRTHAPVWRVPGHVHKRPAVVDRKAAPQTLRAPSRALLAPGRAGEVEQLLDGADAQHLKRARGDCDEDDRAERGGDGDLQRVERLRLRARKLGEVAAEELVDAEAETAEQDAGDACDVERAVQRR